MSSLQHYIIVFPQNVYSPYIYINVVRYFYHLQNVRVHLLIDHNTLYSSLYAKEINFYSSPTLYLYPIETFDLTNVSAQITNIQTALAGLTPSKIGKVYAYEEYDSLRAQTDSHYNNHKQLYFNNLFSFEDIVNTYTNDFPYEEQLRFVRYSTKIYRFQRSEKTIVHKVRTVVNVPFGAISDKRYAYYVDKVYNTTSMNLPVMYKNVNNFCSFIAFLQNADFVVVSNDRMAVMIYHLQTHKDQDNNYLLSPHLPVIFDVGYDENANEYAKEDYPYFLNPHISSWTFIAINDTDGGSVANTTRIPPNHFENINDKLHASLVKIDARETTKHTVSASPDYDLEMLEDVANDFRYTILLDDANNYPTINKDGGNDNLIYTHFTISFVEGGGLFYPLPKYDIVLGKGNINLSIFAIIKTPPSSAPQIATGEDILIFSYGNRDFDLRFYIKELDTYSGTKGELYVLINNETAKTNVVTYDKDTPYLLYFCILSHHPSADVNYLITHMTLYDVENGILTDDERNVATPYTTTENLSNREGGVFIGGAKSSMRIGYFELIRGVQADDDKNDKIIEILQSWNTGLSLSRSDVAVEFEDADANDVVPVDENYDDYYEEVSNETPETFAPTPEESNIKRDIDIPTIDGLFITSKFRPYDENESEIFFTLNDALTEVSVLQNIAELTNPLLITNTLAYNSLSVLINGIPVFNLEPMDLITYTLDTSGTFSTMPIENVSICMVIKLETGQARNNSILNVKDGYYVIKCEYTDPTDCEINLYVKGHSTPLLSIDINNIILWETPLILYCNVSKESSSEVYSGEMYVHTLNGDAEVTIVDATSVTIDTAHTATEETIVIGHTYSDFYIGEVRVYFESLSKIDRKTMTEYLYYKWGNTDTDHICDHLPTS